MRDSVVWFKLPRMPSVEDADPSFLFSVTATIFTIFRSLPGFTPTPLQNYYALFFKNAVPREGGIAKCKVVLPMPEARRAYLMPKRGFFVQSVMEKGSYSLP